MGDERALPRTIEFHDGLLTPAGGDGGAAAPLLAVGAIGAVVLAGGLSMGSLGAAGGGAVVVALVALPLGWRSRVLIDREEGSVTHVRYLLGLPLRTTRHDLSSVRAVQVEHRPGGENQVHDRYAVLLELPGGPLRLELVIDPRTAKSEAARVARFCGVEAQLPEALG